MSLRGRRAWPGALLLAILGACGDVDPPDVREMVVGAAGGTLKVPGIDLYIPTSGGPMGSAGERTFILFHPPAPPAPAGATVRAAAGIGPADFAFPQAARVTVTVSPPAADTTRLRVLRLDTETGAYDEVATPMLSRVDEGRRIRFDVERGGVFALVEDEPA